MPVAGVSLSPFDSRLCRDPESFDASGRNAEKTRAVRPRFERDSCGVASWSTWTGPAAHRIIRQGLEVLCNLAHRGACGCDPETGDGAGALIQIPHEFLRRDCQAMGMQLPSPGDYGVGAWSFCLGSLRRGPAWNAYWRRDRGGGAGTAGVEGTYPSTARPSAVWLESPSGHSSDLRREKCRLEAGGRL